MHIGSYIDKQIVVGKTPEEVGEKVKEIARKRILELKDNTF